MITLDSDYAPAYSAIAEWYWHPSFFYRTARDIMGNHGAGVSIQSILGMQIPGDRSNLGSLDNPYYNELFEIYLSASNQQVVYKQ